RRFQRMITLRLGTRGDIDAVLTFWLDATAEPSTTDDATGLEGLLDRSPGALILAVDGDAIVGTIVAGWDGWRGALYRVSVRRSTPRARSVRCTCRGASSSCRRLCGADRRARSRSDSGSSAIRPRRAPPCRALPTCR